MVLSGFGFILAGKLLSVGFVNRNGKNCIVITKLLLLVIITERTDLREKLVPYCCAKTLERPKRTVLKS